MELLYKAVIMPKLTYGCVVWASACTAKWYRKKLRSAQRHISLGICRAFKSVSTPAALIVANLLPLDFKVVEIVCNKSFNSLVLVPSSSPLIASMVSQARLVSESRRAEQSKFTSFKFEISRLLYEIWGPNGTRRNRGLRPGNSFPR